MTTAPTPGPVFLIPNSRLLAELDRLRMERRALEQRTQTVGRRITALKAELAKRPPVEGRTRDGRRSRAVHGSDGGYYAHLRTWKTEPCEECKGAHALAEDVRRFRRSAEQAEQAAS